MATSAERNAMQPASIFRTQKADGVADGSTAASAFALPVVEERRHITWSPRVLIIPFELTGDIDGERINTKKVRTRASARQSGTRAGEVPVRIKKRYFRRQHAQSSRPDVPIEDILDYVGSLSKEQIEAWIWARQQVWDTEPEIREGVRQIQEGRRIEV